MATPSNESSVLFNLDEIMRLERERIAAETAAARAAARNAQEQQRAAAEAELRQREQARRDEQQRLREETEAAQHAERAAQQAREERLLRLKLEAEAAAQQRVQAVALEHAAQLAELDAQARKQRALKLAMGAVVATCALGALGYVLLLQPALERDRQRSEALARVAQEGASQNAALASELRSLHELREQRARAEAEAKAKARAAAQATAAKKAASDVRTPRTRERAPARTPTAKQTPRSDRRLDAIDARSNDPLMGLDL